ncbi:MAG: folylpolyglutamate synthase/dihydrofolate synthase family protein [Vicingaceae bacterium]
MMDYKESLKYLYEQLPIYQRIGQAAYKADLDNTIRLLAMVGNPERNFKSIHIAGTNGKGSVSHMLASVFQESGLKTGLYTSPHLIDFRERIKINGQMIPQEKVVDFVNKNLKEVKEISPSFFEWTVALAFDYFSEEQVDIAIVETGMGGRLDSTNVLNPLLSIITNIGHDHMRFLGNRLEDIAFEKAGIIKAGTPVVIGSALEQIRDVFEKKVSETDSPITYAEDHEFALYPMDISGHFQTENQGTVLNAIEVLNDMGYQFTDKVLKGAFANVVINTGLRGRWELLSEKPKVIADIAHNKEGILTMLGSLEKESFDELHVVWGSVVDKNAEEILDLMPAGATYYFCCPDVPRGMDVYKLYKIALDLGLTGKPFDSVQKAFTTAKKAAGTNDLVFVGGSTFVVAEVL